ncbi:MAG: peptide-methionine (S)-S-oxide reductase MsrA [Methylobacter sp.]
MKTSILLFRLMLLGILGFGVGTTVAATDSAGLNKATFAGGCFWCMVEAFDNLPGVVEVIAGYTGGQTNNPSYEEVSAGGTGHAEAIQVFYDPAKTSYSKLLEAFWHNVDPTVTDRQFCDVGPEYRAEIFYHDEEQQRLAEQSKAALALSKPFKEPIVTQITAASAFYLAEEYHQHYYRKNPLRFQYYHYTCGRAQRLEELWGSALGR